MSSHFNCTDGDLVPDNCTSDQLATKQWGSSVITLDPLYSNDNYTKAGVSMANWGAFLIPALPQAPEYGYYVTKTHATNGTSPVLFTEAQTADIFAYDYTWFGLNNTYTAKYFAQISNTKSENWNGNQTEFLNNMA